MITKIMKKFWDRNEDGCTWFFTIFFFGVVFGLYFLFIELPPQIPWWTILIGGIGLVEIIYWLTPTGKVKKKENTFKKALKLKLSCIFDVLCFIGLTQLIYSGVKRINLEEIIEFLKSLGWILLVLLGVAAGIFILVGIGYLWIKLNERKFKK